MDLLSGFEDDLFMEDRVKKPTEQSFEVHLKECGWFLSPETDLEAPDSGPSNIYKHRADYHYIKKQYSISITNYEKQLSYLLYDSSARRECLENLIACCTRVGDFANGRKYAECLIKASKTVEHLTSTLSSLLNLALVENDHANSVLHCIRLITLNKYNAYFWSKLAMVLAQLAGMKNLSVNSTSRTFDIVKNCSSTITNDISAVEDGFRTVNDSSSTIENGSSSIKKGSSAVTDGSNIVEDGSSAVKDGSNIVEDGSSTVEDGSSTVEDGSSTLKDGSQEIDLFSLSEEMKVKMLTFCFFMSKFILESSKASSIGLSLEDGEYQRELISQDLCTMKRRIGEEDFLAISAIARDYVYGSMRDSEVEETSESSQTKGKKEDEESTSQILSYGWLEFCDQWFKEILSM